MANIYQIKTARNVRSTDAPVSEMLAGINQRLNEKKVRVAAHAAGLPYVEIRSTPVNADLVHQLDMDEAETALALPFFILGRKMRVAVANPDQAATKKYLAKLKNKRYEVLVNLASESGILAKIAALRALRPIRVQEFQNEDAETNLRANEEEIKNLYALERDVYTLSAKAVLNRLFIGALRTGASDIHFQPEEREMVIRFRIDGVLQKILAFDRKSGEEITNHLKYEAKLQLNVANVPQDGRTSFLAADRKVDVRVSTLPTEYGESAVCRLLDSGRGVRSFEELGFAGRTLRYIKYALSLRSGLVLATGPTGSGKTTTLYTMLDRLNRPEVKITTLEDPIEYHLKNAVQSQVNEGENYTFTNGLRALLRQDPDVMMVGEIRDSVTAETSAQAAMTGHIVLSTLHTNSAIEAIPRLLNLGLRQFVISASVSLVIAQRLIRRVHTDCAEKVSPTVEQRRVIKHYLTEIKKLDSKSDVTMPAKLWQPKGCTICNHSGYRGQVAIAEIFLLTDPLREKLLAGVTSSELAALARAEQKTPALVEDGILKVCAGITTLNEVARVTEIRSFT